MRSSEPIRYQLFLPKAVSERFEQLAAGPGASKSRLLADAGDSRLNRRGTDQLEQRFAARLDRISNQLARIERDGHVSIESPALFIRDRFTAFVQRVGLALASGRLTLIPEDDR